MHKNKSKLIKYTSKKLRINLNQLILKRKSLKINESIMEQIGEVKVKLKKKKSLILMEKKSDLKDPIVIN